MLKLNPEYLKQKQSNPFNYMGSKHRYLADLFEVLPNAKNLTVIDPFLGGGDLISKLPPTWSIFASDAMPQVVELHQAVQDGTITDTYIDNLCCLAGLNKTDEAAYDEAKDLYNKNPDVAELYALLCHSNSNRIRFSDKTGFNMPFGKRTFNDVMQAKLRNYSKILKSLTVDFKCKKFQLVDFLLADLLLIDPPYSNTKATYNERGGWCLNDELELYVKINDAVKHGVKFVYFGQTWSKGIHNQVLENWGSQFNVKILSDTTAHCSANRKTGKTIEVMIWN